MQEKVDREGLQAHIKMFEWIGPVRMAYVWGKEIWLKNDVT
jgi:hypothetical protein